MTRSKKLKAALMFTGPASISQIAEVWGQSTTTVRRKLRKRQAELVAEGRPGADRIFRRSGAGKGHKEETTWELLRRYFPEYFASNVARNVDWALRQQEHANKLFVQLRGEVNGKLEEMHGHILALEDRCNKLQLALDRTQKLQEGRNAPDTLPRKSTKLKS